MSHLPIPQIRTADPALLAGLREVDPTTELVYLGLKEASATWALMRLRPLNDARMKAARNMLRTTLEHSLKAGGIDERRWYARLRSYRMALMGYTVIGIWDLTESPDARILADFKWRAWMLRHDMPYDDEQAEQEARAQKAREAFSDPWLAKQASRALRNPRTVSMNYEH